MVQEIATNTKKFVGTVQHVTSSNSKGCSKVLSKEVHNLRLHQLQLLLCWAVFYHYPFLRQVPLATTGLKYIY